MYLFINYKTITKYILIVYELSTFDHVVGVVSQTRVSGGNRTHDPHANSLSHYSVDDKSALKLNLFAGIISEFFFCKETVKIDKSFL